MSIDPLAEAQNSWSPYHYTYGNPISHIDPTGMKGEAIGADGLTNEQWMNSSRPNAVPYLDDYYKTVNKQNEWERSDKIGKGNVMINIKDFSNSILDPKGMAENNTIWDFINVMHFYKAIDWLKIYLKKHNISYFKNIIVFAHGNESSLSLGGAVIFQPPKQSDKVIVKKL
ncbi:MAG TPA: hypothetical protein VJ951_09845 [Bacteroidales bacterium]|nr:hypothetical protein [Bacteroidales bacterium]